MIQQRPKEYEGTAARLRSAPLRKYRTNSSRPCTRMRNRGCPDFFSDRSPRCSVGSSTIQQVPRRLLLDLHEQRFATRSHRLVSPSDECNVLPAPLSWSKTRGCCSIHLSILTRRSGLS